MVAVIDNLKTSLQLLVMLYNCSKIFTGAFVYLNLLYPNNLISKKYFTINLRTKIGILSLFCKLSLGCIMVLKIAENVIVLIPITIQSFINMSFLVSRKCRFWWFWTRFRFSIFNEMVIYRPGCTFHCIALPACNFHQRFTLR